MRKRSPRLARPCRGPQTGPASRPGRPGVARRRIHHHPQVSSKSTASLRPCRSFAASKPIFGTCAGAILLAREVLNPAQRSLGVLDAVVERNAYGRQIDSAIVTAQTALPGGPLEMVFIRAPRIVETGAGVEVLARRDGFPTLVRQGQRPGRHLPSRTLARPPRAPALRRGCSRSQANKQAGQANRHTPSYPAQPCNPESPIHRIEKYPIRILRASNPK